MQFCTIFNWVYLKCSLLSFSGFRTFSISHSWSCPPCCFWRSHTYRYIDFLLQLVCLHCSIWPLLLMQHSHPSLAFKPLILFPPTLYFLPLHPHYRLMLLAVSLYLLLSLSLSDSLMVLQWNAGGLRARSTKLLYYISSHPVDLICIQESNLNLFSSFRITGFSALRSDRSHSQSGIFSNVTDASRGVIIFIGRAYPFLSFLPSLFLCLIPTLIMQRSTSL